MATAKRKASPKPTVRGAAAASPLDRVRTICLALPETEERPSHGTSTWRTPKRMFAMYSAADTHHGGGRDGVWLFCTSHNQELMIASDPERFFSPPYVGCHGWVGMWLNRKVKWREVKAVIGDAHAAAVAAKPKKLATSRRRN
jgi:predicted DNA-binding protein (MmcQ/YjbR family)